MSQINQILPPPAPPPPPPQPLCLSPQVVKVNPQVLNKNELSGINENELDTALERLLLNHTEFSKIFFKSNTYCVPQLQDGPKCGLVALSIATSVLQTSVTVDKIFETAVSLKLTNQGEMFSVKSLAYLAENCCSFKTRIIEGGLSAHLNCILKCLLKKNFLLVPYDADFNHTPCCKKGSKAHWALITGFIIIQQKNDQSNENNNDFVLLNSNKSSALCECSDSFSELQLNASVHQGKIKIEKTTPKGIGKSSEGIVYLIGMQGKSRHFGLWPFEGMAESNDNLIFFPADRDSSCYVVPEGGLVEGLKGRAIILEYP